MALQNELIQSVESWDWYDGAGAHRRRPPVAPGITRTNQRPRNLFQPIRMRSGANEVQLADGASAHLR